MTDKYKSLREALDATSFPGPIEVVQDGAEHVLLVAGEWVIAVADTGSYDTPGLSQTTRYFNYIAAADPNTIRALLADHDEAQALAHVAMEHGAKLEAERAGWLDQHHRDSKTLREYCQQRDDLRKERDALMSGFDERGDEIDALVTERDALLDALREIHHWMDSQSDAQSKGCHASFDLMMLRQMRDIAASAMLAQHQGEKHGNV